MAYDPYGGARDMVERVAIAISLVDDPRPPEVSVADHYRSLARSALVAMREPTPAMAAKGFIADNCTAPMDVWRAMIDEALAN